MHEVEGGDGAEEEDGGEDGGDYRDGDGEVRFPDVGGVGVGGCCLGG